MKKRARVWPAHLRLDAERRTDQPYGKRRLVCTENVIRLTSLHASNVRRMMFVALAGVITAMFRFFGTHSGSTVEHQQSVVPRMQNDASYKILAAFEQAMSFADLRQRQDGMDWHCDPAFLEQFDNDSLIVAR